MLTLDTAYTDLKEAKAARKTAKDAVKQSQESNQTLVDLKEAKKQSAAEYESELLQWQATHQRLITAAKDASDEYKEAKERFDDAALLAKKPEQLSLDLLDGDRKVRVLFTTKLEVEKEKKADSVQERHEGEPASA